MADCEVAEWKPSLGYRIRSLFRWRLRERLANLVFWVWRNIVSSGDLNSVAHAEREFEILGWSGRAKDDPQTWVCENILDLIRVFASQGHSGSSAPYVLNAFMAVARFNPIGPLTGKDEEWGEDHGGGCCQNRRCGEVFKDEDGNPYWAFGRVFRDPDGGCYTSVGSRVDIEFPWTKPEKPEYVDVED